ncbi:MAG: hypothetical protein PUF89_06790 [Lactobacillus porci]|nr:hypothetical protein [Lactobacillus porci]
MRKITKSLLTALSLATSVVSLVPAASAGVASAAVKTTTTMALTLSVLNSTMSAATSTQLKPACCQP